MSLLRRLLRSTDEFIERGGWHQRDSGKLGPKCECWKGQVGLREPYTTAVAATAPCSPTAPPPACPVPTLPAAGPLCIMPAARRGPFGESSRMLFQFKTPEDLAQWSTFSDGELGGKSTADLKLADEPQVCSLLCALAVCVCVYSLQPVAYRKATRTPGGVCGTKCRHHTCTVIRAVQLDTGGPAWC